jgi:zinc/manganese transport system substrate-binding protein
MGKKFNNLRALLIAVALVVVIGLGVVLTKDDKQTSQGAVIQVVAGENFWGSLASQIGGKYVHVTSIVSDPNADPHEYETNASDARAFATANYVILNGAGYDSWGNKLVSADNNSSQKVLTVATLLGKKDGDNPHFWYNPTYVNEVVAQIKSNLTQIDPSEASYFNQQYKTLQTSLAVYQDRIAEIKKQFAGTKVAATEDIFQYLATATGLDLISPEPFIEAVAEGNDPPTSSVVTFQQQLENDHPSALVYNEQTVTPLTNSMKQLAADNNIPIVGVTETIQPPDVPFQDWMNAELINLQNALNSQELGQ